MLRIKMGANNAHNTAIVSEGDYVNGMRLEKKDLERILSLPDDYQVGTCIKDENFWYKVIEV